MEKIKQLIKNNDAKFYLAIFLFCFITSLIFKPENQTPKQLEELSDISTYIPNGYSLITCNIKNIKKITPIIGSQGVVDLYSDQTNSPKLVAKNIRVIKAPHADDYGILCPTPLCPALLKHPEVYAVVKNPKAENTVISATKKIKTKRRLIFYEESP